MAERPAFFRRRIRDDAVTLTAFMIFRQVLGNRHAVLPDEEQAMAIFIDLHLVAGAHPASQLGFGLLVRIKVARAEGFAQFVHVGGKAQHDRISDGLIRVHGRAAFLGEAFHILPHFFEALFARFTHSVPRIPTAQ